MKFAAILFDMDGVIVDSEPAHEKAFIATLTSRGIAMNHDDYVSYFSGKPGPRALTDFFTARRIDGNIDELMSYKEEWYLQNSFGTVTGYDSTIRFIKKHSTTLPRALVTSSLRRITLPTLDKYDLLDQFSAIITLDDVATGKPDPEGYLLAARDLNVSPTECVVVEDSPAGIAAAKAAGTYCVALTTTHRREALHEADMIVDELNDVLFK